MGWMSAFEFQKHYVKFRTLNRDSPEVENIEFQKHYVKFRTYSFYFLFVYLS